MHITPPLWQELVAPPIYESHVFSLGDYEAKSGTDLTKIVREREIWTIANCFHNKFEIIVKILRPLAIEVGHVWYWEEVKIFFLSLPCKSLYCCLLVLLVSFCSSGVPGGVVLPGYGSEENRVVQNELVRILELEHTLIGAGAYSHFLSCINSLLGMLTTLYCVFFCSSLHRFAYLVVHWNLDVYQMLHNICWRNFAIIVVYFM